MSIDRRRMIYFDDVLRIINYCAYYILCANKNICIYISIAVFTPFKLSKSRGYIKKKPFEKVMFQHNQIQLELDSVVRAEFESNIVSIVEIQ